MEECVALLAAAVCCAHPEGVTAAATMRALTLEGGLSGSIETLDDDTLVLRKDDGGRRRIAAADLLSLEFDDPDEAVPRPSQWVILSNGDRLGVELLESAGDALACRRPGSGAGEFTVPLETIVGVMLQAPAERRAAALLQRELQERSFESDILFLTDGDRLSGLLLELDENVCRWQTAVGEVDVDRSRVLGIGFNSSLTVALASPESETVLRLRDGSWLTCRAVGFDGGESVVAESLAAGEIDAPIRSVRAIDFFGPRVTPLSELEPLEVEMIPYLSREQPMRRDRNVRGGPLALGGETFARGLGMQSRTSAVYQLEGRFTAFRALIGIDDAAEGAGSAVFSVGVDGEPVFESGPVGAGEPPRTVGPIDVRNAETITLTVDFGLYGDIGDLADWCNAVLIE